MHWVLLAGPLLLLQFQVGEAAVKMHEFRVNRVPLCSWHNDLEKTGQRQLPVAVKSVLLVVPSALSKQWLCSQLQWEPPRRLSMIRVVFLLSVPEPITGAPQARYWGREHSFPPQTDGTTGLSRAKVLRSRESSSHGASLVAAHPEKHPSRLEPAGSVPALTHGPTAALSCTDGRNWAAFGPCYSILG